MYIRGTVGGNTSCVEVSDGDTEIIIDAGSGLRNLGDRLLAGRFGRGLGTAHVLLSHFHWDHIQGIPFFIPMYILGNRFFLYSPKHEFRHVLELQQNSDNFPRSFDDMAADIRFVDLGTSKKLIIDNITIRWIKLKHPGDSYAYRLDTPAGSVVYASDSEYELLNTAEVESYIQFFSGCDILIFDSMFTVEMAEECKGWGHSTPNMGARIALCAQTKKLILFHHNPSYDDMKLEEVRKCAMELAENMNGGDLDVIVAREGLTLTL